MKNDLICWPYWPLLFTLNLLLIPSVDGQTRPSVQQPFSGQGVVQAIHPGELVVRLADGEPQTFKIQDKDEDALSLDGGQFIFRNLTAKISVKERCRPRCSSEECTFA